MKLFISCLVKQEVIWSSGAHRDGYKRAKDTKRNRGDGYFIKAAMVAQSLDLGDQRRLVSE